MLATAIRLFNRTRRGAAEGLRVAAELLDRRDADGHDRRDVEPTIFAPPTVQPGAHNVDVAHEPDIDSELGNLKP